MADHFAELVEVHRFLNVAVHAVLIAASQVAFFFGRGQDNDRNRPRPSVVLDCAEHFESVHLRQFQVQENEARRRIERPLLVLAPAEEELQGFFPVPNHVNPIG